MITFWYLVSQTIIEALIVWYVAIKVPRVRKHIIPEGWKIKRRGFPGRRGWDVFDPHERQWMGWRFASKSTAVDNAWRRVHVTLNSRHP